MRAITNRPTLLRSATAVTASLGLAAALCLPAVGDTHNRRTSVFHRHPTATAAAAGVGAYALAKHSHHGVFHRHPVLTGIGAAAVAHHMAKHHR